MRRAYMIRIPEGRPEIVESLRLVMVNYGAKIQEKSRDMDVDIIPQDGEPTIQEMVYANTIIERLLRDGEVDTDK